MLQPTNQWQWQYCPTDDYLRLDLDETLAFNTAYRKKHLTEDVHRDSDFSVEDANFYQYIAIQLQKINRWQLNKVVQIALNATAVQRFFKPTMPKSWFFKANQQATREYYPNNSYSTGQFCSLYTASQEGLFLLIEFGPVASLCMLLDEQLNLSNTRCMGQFEVIKVMNDRLFLPIQSQALCSA